MPPKAVFDVARAAQLHADGMSLQEVAKLPGMPCSVVIAKHMHEHGYRVYMGWGRPPAIPVEDLRRLHCEEHVPAEEIGKVYGCGATTVRRQLVAATLNKGRGRAKKLRGPENPNWRGGRTVDQKGYVFLYRPDHPQAKKDGYVAEHRMVMSDHLGRTLETKEEVHHINGVHGDNRLENLVVIRKGKHQRLHADVCRELWQLRQEVARLAAASGRHSAMPPYGFHHSVDWKIVG